MEKLKTCICKICAEKTVKVKITENDDEISVEISRCTKCNYQNNLTDLRDDSE